MIDEKKIEEAASQFAMKQGDVAPFVQRGFLEGARWILKQLNRDYMINSKIEEAAKDNYLQYADPRKVHLDKFQISEESFKTGIKWFLDSLWHPMSESPKMGSEILIKINKKAYEGSGVNPSSTIVHEYDYHDDWEFYAKDARFLQWMYTDDLQTI